MRREQWRRMGRIESPRRNVISDNEKRIYDSSGKERTVGQRVEDDEVDISRELPATEDATDFDLRASWFATGRGAPH